MNKTLLYVAGALGLIWIFRKSSASSSLKYVFKGIDLRNRSISVELINPSNTPLNFTALVADVLLNDSNVGLIDFRQNTQIPAAGSKVINIPIKLNPIGLLQFTLSKARNFQTIGFNGTLNAEKLSIPFNEVIKFGKQ
jgi:hypothetical protein